MIKEEFPGPDPARSRLRAAVASVTDAFAKMPTISGASSSSVAERELHASWTALVDLLALGPEPALRECPSCGKSGIRNATLCSNCWAKLTPPSHEAVTPT